MMPAPAIAHPRLWFTNPDGSSNGRLEYLQARKVAGSAEWNYWMGKIDQAAEEERWQYILKWKVTGAGGDLTTALSQCDAFITSCTNGGMAYILKDPGTGND